MTTGHDATRRDILKRAGATAALGTLAGFMPAAVQAAAPMLGVSRPSIYRFKVGAFEVTNILDGFIQGNGPHPNYGNNQPADVVQAYASAQGLPPTRMENIFVNTIVNTGKELVLFDTGNGKARATTVGHLPDRLVSAGYKPEDIDVVVITHGHGDHVGGLMADGKPVYPNARYVFSDREFDFWTKGDVPEARKVNRDLFMRVAAPLGEKATMLKADGEVVSGIRAVAAYGHTPGMLAFRIESEGRQLLNWADTANHYVMAVQQPDWHVGADHDKEAGAANRRRIFDMVSTDRIPVVGYHMPFPSVGFVEKSGASYRWVPASYQLNL